MVKDENKTFDPNVTKWFGWAYLIATLLYDILFFYDWTAGLVFLIGDHSLYTIGAMLYGLVLDGIEQFFLWPMVLKFCCLVGTGLLISVIPVCIAAIRKKKELPLLIFDAASMVNAAILAGYAIYLNGFTFDIAYFVITATLAPVPGNAVFFILLLRQYRAKRAHLRQAAAGAEETTAN